MSAPPYMPLFVGDYLADTTHLTCTEHGAYILLLMSMWRAGGALPDDAGKLARFARCSTGQWARISETILAFFDRQDGLIVHGRLVREMTKHAVAVEQRRQAASNGGRAKALKNNNVALPGASSPLCQPEPEPEKKDSTTTYAGDWRRMLDEAREAAGDAADLTRPAMHHVADLRALVEPTSGEPCTWAEVLDAIRMTALRQRAKGRPITTWKWVQADAWSLRDKRLTAAAPAVADASAPRATGPPNSLTDKIAAENAEARRRAFEMLDAQDGPKN